MVYCAHNITVAGPGRFDIRGVTPGNELEHAVAAWSLGEVHVQRESYEIAEKYHREAMLVRRDRLHEDHLDRAASKNSLALCLWQQGKSEEAEQLLRRALEIRSKTLAEDDPDLNVTLHNLALCMDDVGVHEEAARTYDAAMTHLHNVPNHVELQLKVVHGPRHEVEPVPVEQSTDLEGVLEAAQSFPTRLERTASLEAAVACKPSFDFTHESPMDLCKISSDLRKQSIERSCRKPSVELTRKPSMESGASDTPMCSLPGVARPLDIGLDRASTSRANEPDTLDRPTDSRISIDGSQSDHLAPLPSFVFNRLEYDENFTLRGETKSAALSDPNICEANGRSPKYASILRGVEFGQPLLNEVTVEKLATLQAVDMLLDSHVKPPLGRGRGMKKSSSLIHSLNDLQNGLPAPKNAIHHGLLGSLKNLIGSGKDSPPDAASDAGSMSDWNLRRCAGLVSD